VTLLGASNVPFSFGVRFSWRHFDRFHPDVGGLSVLPCPTKAEFISVYPLFIHPIRALPNNPANAIKNINGPRWEVDPDKARTPLLLPQSATLHTNATCITRILLFSSEPISTYGGFYWLLFIWSLICAAINFSRTRDLISRS
jgi:hypothetical protein